MIKCPSVGFNYSGSEVLGYFHCQITLCHLPDLQHIDAKLSAGILCLSLISVCARARVRVCLARQANFFCFAALETSPLDFAQTSVSRVELIPTVTLL